MAVSIDGGASFGGSSHPTSGHFRYVASCFVTRLSPRTGPDTGGTAITIHGTGFSHSSEFTCTFGNGRIRGDPRVETVEPIVTPAAFISPSQLTCIAPALKDASQIGIAVPVVISVNVGDGFIPVGTTTNEPVEFTFMPGIQLRFLDPNHGPVTGGTVVDISGANFGGAEGGLGNNTATETVWCRFGSTVSTGSRISNGLLRCKTPPRGLEATGNVEVAVSVNGGADFTGGAYGVALVMLSSYFGWTGLSVFFFWETSIASWLVRCIKGCYISSCGTVCHVVQFANL